MVVVLQNKLSISGILLIVFVTVILIFLGFKDNNYSSVTVAYNVYLNGDVIGTVASDEEFDDYINQMQNKVKEKYGVNKVYLPDGVTVKKVFTYDGKYDSNVQVYNKLVEENNFTIKCVIITIDSPEKEDYKKRTIYVLDKSIFDEAVETMIRAFVGSEEYDNYINDTQEEIVDTGIIIESIGIEEDITYKVGYVSTDNKIFTNSEELSKYLLYGTVEEQSKYLVKEGDTIEDVAEANSLNVEEFLIANPEFTSANNLLYEGQEVVVGLIDPIISVEEVVHSVSDEVHAYAVEVQYDKAQLTIYEETIQKGQNGLDRVTKKLQYLNGQLVNSTNVSTTEITPSVSKVIVKGSRVAAHIADLSYWAWPTNKPYTITTYYGYRWGSMHAAIDIAGTGYNSPLYAINNGTIIAAGAGCVVGNSSCNGGRGNYIIINHNIGNYYSVYMHMNNVYVKVGDKVERGTKVGTMGNTGHVVPAPTASNPYGGTHLHIATYRGNPLSGGSAFNPLSLYR